MPSMPAVTMPRWPRRSGRARPATVRHVSARDGPARERRASTCPGRVVNRALLHDVHRAGHRQRHDRQPRFEGQQKAAGLETADLAIRASRAFGKISATCRRRPAAASGSRMPDRSGLLPIDEQMAGAREVPPEKRKSAQRFLGDDAELKRQRGEDRPECRRCSGDWTTNMYVSPGVDPLEPLHASPPRRSSPESATTMPARTSARRALSRSTKSTGSTACRARSCKPKWRG